MSIHRISWLIVLVLAIFIGMSKANYSSPPSSPNFLLDTSKIHIEFNGYGFQVFGRFANGTVQNAVSVDFSITQIEEAYLDASTSVNCPAIDNTSSICNFTTLKLWDLRNRSLCTFPTYPAQTVWNATLNAYRTYAWGTINCTSGPIFDLYLDTYDRDVSFTFDGLTNFIPFGSVELTAVAYPWVNQPQTNYLRLLYNVTMYFPSSAGLPTHYGNSIYSLTPNGIWQATVISNNVTFPGFADIVLNLLSYAQIDGNFSVIANFSGWQYSLGYEADTNQGALTITEFAAFAAFKDSFIYDPNLQIFLSGDNPSNPQSPSPNSKAKKVIIEIVTPVVLGVILIAVVAIALAYKYIISPTSAYQTKKQRRRTQHRTAEDS